MHLVSALVGMQRRWPGQHPEFWSMALGVVMPATVSPETPGLLPVKEAGEKPLPTMTCCHRSSASKRDVAVSQLHRPHAGQAFMR